MKNRITINSEVDVTAVYFHSADMKTFPRRMEYNGSTYTFADGLQYLVQKGQDLIQIFDMTDGSANYRLRRNGNQSAWTLVAITSQ